MPQPGPNQALVKISTAAQNPTDVLCFDNKIFGNGSVLGCDFTGTVEALGSDVKRLKVGDTIAGLIWGGIYWLFDQVAAQLTSLGEIEGQGAYSEYTLADEKICFKVPDNIPLEQAATVPLAATTAWLALFRSQSLAIDRTAGSDVQLLIWAGSSTQIPTAYRITLTFRYQLVSGFTLFRLQHCSAFKLRRCAVHDIFRFFTLMEPSTSLTTKILRLFRRSERLSLMSSTSLTPSELKAHP